MQTLIHTRVSLARAGENPFLICKMPSGWAVMGDVQPLDGYCLLLADPIVESINDLSEDDRIKYALDCARIGDALLSVTDAYRINYETWGNTEPALHTHIMPRYMSERAEARRLPACVSYSWSDARPFSPQVDGVLVDRLRALLAPPHAESSTR